MSDKLRVAVFTKGIKIRGGASKIGMQLVELLKKDGHYVHHYRRNLEYGYTEFSTPVYGKYEYIAKKSYYKLRLIGFQELIPWEYFHLVKEIKKHKFDLIHFHDITGAISPYTLYLLSKIIPVVWTVHDVSPFTGGCFRTAGCNNYMSGCFSCPQINQWPLGCNIDISFFYRWLKSKVHKTKRVKLVFPSKWVYDFGVKSNMIEDDAPTIINNGVDVQTFRPEPYSLSRVDMGLSDDDFVILILANFVGDYLKGIDHALKVIDGIKHLDPFVLVVGSATDDLADKLEGFRFYNTGHITSEYDLSDYYSMSDIFLNCTLADNFPLTVLESISCATPVIGFNTGGIPEIITNDVDGFLVEQGDTDALIDVLSQLHKSKDYKRLSINARKSAVEKFSLDTFYQKYLNVYRNTINEFNK